jgi:hypothetical protein
MGDQYNEEEVVDSKAPYIIICNGRIQVMLTSSDRHLEKIGYASRAATELVTYYGITIGKRLDPVDVKPLSDHQHWLMANMFSLTIDEVDYHIQKLFTKLDALEAKYKG